MASRIPLVLVNGQPQQLQAADTLTPAALAVLGKFSAVGVTGINAPVASATPTLIGSDSTYGNTTPGRNYKLMLYMDGYTQSHMGFGVAELALEYFCASGADHKFYKSADANLGEPPVLLMTLSTAGNLTTTGNVIAANSPQTTIYNSGISQIHTIPSGHTCFIVKVCGGGGGGGSGKSAAITTARSGGSGGGGGCAAMVHGRTAVDGFTIRYTAGGGGAGGAAATGANGNNGIVGDSSTIAFGIDGTSNIPTLIVRGGGGGRGGATTIGSGGSGGGTMTVGVVGTGADTIGGSPATVAAANGVGGQGAGSQATVSVDAGSGEWGGGAGGQAIVTNVTFGNPGGSLHGGAGGGGGGGMTSGNVALQPTGGGCRSYSTSVVGGNPGTSGVTGTVGAASTFSTGGGGGGGGSSSAAAGATGGAGTLGGGGGGGGAASGVTNASGAGGAGGAGYVIITSW